MSKIKLGIKDSIAETLFITLYAKAEETKQKDPLITAGKLILSNKNLNYKKTLFHIVLHIQNIM